MVQIVIYVNEWLLTYLFITWWLDDLVKGFVWRFPSLTLLLSVVNLSHENHEIQFSRPNVFLKREF